MPRPYWSGQIQISLVSFGVELFPATETKSEIRFHQLSRRTGERIKHQKVASDEAPVDNSDIVKGYEYNRGQYIQIEPEEIANVRIPSRHNIELTQFVGIDEVTPAYFEKPYFVVPKGDTQAEAFAVVRAALRESKRCGLGKIAFGGREHLVALAAPNDDSLAGMMAYTMRYAEELRNPATYFADIRRPAVDEDQLSLAKELIKRKSAKFAPEKFRDEYEAALRAMVEAKIQHLPVPQEEAAPQSSKVINLMDALRKSVQGGDTPPKKKPTRETAAKAPKPAAQKKGMTLVKPSKSA